MSESKETTPSETAGRQPGEKKIVLVSQDDVHIPIPVDVAKLSEFIDAQIAEGISASSTNRS